MADSEEGAVAAKQQAAAASLMTDFADEVTAAKQLLDFAIEGGFTPDNGRMLDPIWVSTIKKAEDAIATGGSLEAEARTNFELAYRQLALWTSPVTVTTLRATSDLHGRRAFPFALNKSRSEAIIWSRKMMFITVMLMTVALIGTVLDGLLDTTCNGIATLSWEQWVYRTLRAAQPFTYGAIGACVYLLKTLHAFIYQRSFDPARVPEYYDRILLGAVSGGMIVLFVAQTAGDGSQLGNTHVIHFSAAALGFIAGYNTDFLFSAIERMVAAVLPRVGIDSMQRATTPIAGTLSLDGLTLKDLLDRHQQATDPTEKQVLADLITKVRDRL